MSYRYTNRKPIGKILVVDPDQSSKALVFDALKVFLPVLDLDDNNVQALAGIGRLKFQQGRSEEASVYLRIANNQAPGNVERLCALGEIELSQFEAEGAKDHFAAALIHDPDSDVANAGFLIANNLEQYITNYAQTSHWRSFASMCNTVGVFLVREGDIEAGIEQYSAAMKFLRDDATKSRVAFNLGLGYLRWNKPKDAINWLSKAMVGADDDVSRKKVSRYLDLARAYAAEQLEPQILADSPNLDNYALSQDKMVVGGVGFTLTTGESLADDLLGDESEMSLFDDV